MAKLILARHGQTPYNEAGIWTGLTDVGLTQQGIEEARAAGEFLSAVAIHAAYCSLLRRTRMTLCEIIAKNLNIQNLSHQDIHQHAALNERDYGVLTGMSKQAVRSAVGEAEFLRIRRGWSHPIQDGETLQDVHARIKPFHERYILPELDRQKNVLVVGSNNSLRAYVKELQDVPEEAASSIELGTAEVRIYEHDGLTIAPDPVVQRFGAVH